MATRPDNSAGKLPRRSFAKEPVHAQLIGLCREAIFSGKFVSGERFPSERELSQLYGVSRTTANKVITGLIGEGLLDLQKGIGTRVCKRRSLFASLDGMESFTAHARKQGLVPSTEVLRFERLKSQALPQAVREGLGIPAKKRESIVYLERLRMADDVPMIHETRWVREKLAPGLEKEDVSESFYGMLEEKFDLPMTGENHTISAVILDKAANATFQCRKPIAALRVEGVGFVKGDEPLWYQTLLYRGDRYQLHNQTKGTAGTAIELRFNENRRTA